MGRRAAPSITIRDDAPRLAIRRPAARRARRLSARLPRHLRAADDRRERSRDRDPRRAGPPANGRRAVHEGRALPRAHLFGAARAAPDAARRAQRRRPFRAHLLGRGAGRDRDPIRRHRRFAGRPAGHPALQLRRARWASCSTRRWIAASSTGSGASLLDRTICASAGKAGWTSVIGAAVGHGLRAVREQQAHPDLGQQPRRLESALLDARAGSEAPRRQADRDRSVSQRHRREVPRAHRA